MGPIVSKHHSEHGFLRSKATELHSLLSPVASVPWFLSGENDTKKWDEACYEARVCI